MAIIPIQLHAICDSDVPTDPDVIANYELNTVPNRAVVADLQELDWTAAGCNPDLGSRKGDSVAKPDGQVSHYFWHILVQQQTPADTLTLHA